MTFPPEQLEVLRQSLDQAPAWALLRADNRPKVIEEPFPHIIVDNALPKALYRELCATKPPDEYLTAVNYKGPNRYHRRSASELLYDDNIELHPGWRRFIEYHLSSKFYRSALLVFSGCLADAERIVRDRLGKSLAELKPLMRNAPDGRGAPALSECQISHVTPAEQPGSPLGPHVDREVALWAGLYYLADHPEPAGGDLVFYRFRNPSRREYWRDQMIPPELVETVEVVRARGNRLVMFPHSADAVHGVTPRVPDGKPRQSVNLVCEFPFKVFDIAPWRRNIETFPWQQN